MLGKASEGCVVVHITLVTVYTPAFDLLFIVSLLSDTCNNDMLGYGGDEWRAGRRVALRCWPFVHGLMMMVDVNTAECSEVCFIRNASDSYSHSCS